MAQLYDRSVILNVYPVSGSSKKIDGLRVKFRIVKTSESNPNTAELEIYNLSESSRAMFQAKDSRVDIQVGYKGVPPDNSYFGSLPGFGSSGNVESVFIGNVAAALAKKESGGKRGKSKSHKYTQSIIQAVDIITKVQLADGENRYRNARLTKGFPPNTSLNQVLDELTKQLGLAKGARIGVPNQKYANALTLSGLVRDHLNVLTKGNGLQWSIQNETLQILPKAGATTDGVILLNPTTGLVGSPQKSDKGIEFSSLLQPQLIPGRRVKIESKFINGTFVVRKVTHEGDSHEGEFLSKCEAGIPSS